QQQLLIRLAKRLRGHVHTIGILEHPCRNLVVPRERVPAHLDVVSLSEAKNGVAWSEIKVPFLRLCRVPLQVISRSYAVVVQSGKLTMRSQKILLQGCKTNQEVRGIGLRD